MKPLLLVVVVGLAPTALLAQSPGAPLPGNGKSLPQPYATKSVNEFSNVIGWANDQRPLAPEGFTVTLYADGLENPRNTYVLPNGDVLVAESNTIKNAVMQVGAKVLGAGKSENMKTSANRVSLLRDLNNDGRADSRTDFLVEQPQPFGLLLLDSFLYVGNTNAIVRYPYVDGQTTMDAKGETILSLPNKPNRHWTRNLLANSNGTKIYVAVGSADDHGEKGIDKEKRRTAILEINPDGTGERVYASGLRNPVGMGWAPGTSTLWTAVNERDYLGNDLVPDYATSVRDGGFYGWPYSYYGQHTDPRVKEQRPDLVEKAIVPDVPLGAHTASLGLAFYTGNKFPERYRNGAFIAQHGSYNRSELSGYKVVFIPFQDGKPSGEPEVFLDFRSHVNGKYEANGRPVGVTMMPDGAMLVTDDVNNRIWRVAASSDYAGK